MVTPLRSMLLLGGPEDPIEDATQAIAMTAGCYRRQLFSRREWLRTLSRSKPDCGCVV